MTNISFSSLSVVNAPVIDTAPATATVSWKAIR